MNQNRGFTLVELVLTIALLGIIGWVTGVVMIRSVESYSIVSDRKLSLSDARLAIDRIASDIRLIQATSDIQIFTASQMVFNIPSEPNITYNLVGSNLQRSGFLLASPATQLAFNYLDDNGNETAVKANIKRIRVTVSIGTHNSHGVNQIRTTIFPRNFYYADYTEQ